jgi:hypothetical protein
LAVGLGFVEWVPRDPVIGGSTGMLSLVLEGIDAAPQPIQAALYSVT